MIFLLFFYPKIKKFINAREKILIVRVMRTYIIFNKNKSFFNQSTSVFKRNCGDFYFPC
jgi:hypothetical protein